MNLITKRIAIAAFVFMCLLAAVFSLPDSAKAGDRPALAARRVFNAGSFPRAVAVGDFNQDGLFDLAVVDFTSPGGIPVLLNTFAAPGPTLTVLPIDTVDKTITFSWPFSASGYNLESLGNLDSGNWQAAGRTRMTNGGNVEVTVPIGQGNRFFRLRR